MLEKLRHLLGRVVPRGTEQVRLTRGERDERDRVLAHRWERVRHGQEEKP